MAQEENWFKDISYLELCCPFCSAEQNNLCNFGRRHHEEHFCNFFLNVDQWFKRCCLKNFLSRALASLMYSGLEQFMQF